MMWQQLQVSQQQQVLGHLLLPLLLKSLHVWEVVRVSWSGFMLWSAGQESCGVAGSLDSR